MEFLRHDEACGKKRGRRNKGDTWWCNEEMKGAMCRDSIEENMSRYKSMMNETKTVVLKAMR